MTHKRIVIEARDLYNRLSETDNITESADWIGAGDLFTADGSFNRESRGSWYVVSWADHVVTPRYNGDCSCSGPFATRDEARASNPDAVVYFN